MANEVCGECGRPHERQPPADLLILDVDGRPFFDPDDHQAPPTDRSRLIAAMIAVAVLVFGVWVLGFYGGGSSRPSDLSGEPGGVGESQPLGDENSVATTTPVSGDLGSGVTSGRLGAGDQTSDAFDTGQLASSLLTALDTTARISFFTGDVVTTLDLGSGSITTAKLSTEQVHDLEGFVLLSDGVRAVGIVPDDPSQVVLLGSAGEIVATAHPKTYTVVTPADDGRELFIGRLLEGFTRVLSVPAGSGRLSVPGLGVLVTPPTGGTYLATVTGFELFSSARVVAATIDAWLEVRCDATLECAAAVVDRSTGRETAVDPTFVETVGTILISPDSRWLLRAEPNETVLYDTVTAATEIVPVLSAGHPRWAPDSSFIVWLDAAGEVPALEFALVGVESSGTFRVGLSSLGEELPGGEEFVLYP